MMLRITNMVNNFNIPIYYEKRIDLNQSQAFGKNLQAIPITSFYFLDVIYNYTINEHTTIYENSIAYLQAGIKNLFARGLKAKLDSFNENTDFVISDLQIVLCDNDGEQAKICQKILIKGQLCYLSLWEESDGQNNHQQQFNQSGSTESSLS